MPYTIGDLITDALLEIRVARAGDVLSPDAMAFGLNRLNALLDLWNADHRKVYASGYADYVFTPLLSPHTIGPGGSFNVASRPVEVDAIMVNLGSSVYVPVFKRDKAWYARQSLPALATTLPTDFYFDPDWPLGKLFFWPVPSTAYGLRLWSRALLAAVAQGDTVSLPPGYQLGITLTLAESVAPGFGQTVSAETKEAARIARATIFGNNDEVPRIATADAGLSPGRGGLGFNFTNRSYS